MNIRKGVKPFSWAGIDIFNLSVDELRDLLAYILQSEKFGFTFEYETTKAKAYILK